MRLSETAAATLANGGAVVTSSSRAARGLTRLYGERQREAGKRAWPAADILDWDAWLHRLWVQQLRKGVESRLMLSQAQEHAVWARLVKPSIEGRRLISVDGVAELAQEAYALLCAYDSLDFLNSQMLGPDADSFCLWARQFERECERSGWLSAGKLALSLYESMSESLSAASPAPLPRSILLAGFDRETPAQKKLLATIESRGCTVQRLAAECGAMGPSSVVIASDARDEIAVCAQWVRRELELAATAQRETRIGVIVPALKSLRGDIERIFRQELAPHSIAVDSPETSLPFEFSLGTPLDRLPVIRAALLLLSWLQEPLRQEEISWLLLSGFVWAELSDLLPVAEFDSGMHATGILPPEYTLDDYLQRRGWGGDPGRHPSLRGLLQRLRFARKIWRDKQGQTVHFAEWITATREILAAAGWPGAHRLLSEDFQILARWEQLLDTVEGLAFDGRRVTYRQFLETLKRQAALTIFSPQSRGAAVEILGPFESAGIDFDSVWFLGADDSSWPPSAQPHPFLPTSLQKQRGMPHADDEADWELAGLATTRLQRTAQQCTFSYSARDKDGEHRPSTLLGKEWTVVPAAEMRERLITQDESQREFQPLPIEEETTSAVPWPVERSPGGYSVLKMQAACPFQAFATVRLRAGERNLEDWGLDPSQRGNLLHKILETLWGELKSRNTLLEWEQLGTLRAAVERHVDTALARYQEKTPEGEEAPEKWSSAYLQVERRRIVRLVEEWLEYELRRAPFTVESTEQTLLANVGDLQLKLRADRVDRVAEGRLLVDYKTGKATSSGWEEERLDDPQLPLYAAFGNLDDLRGVLLAKVREDSIKLEGRAEGSVRDGIPEKKGISEYSSDLRRRWEKSLLTIGAQFLKGEAQVDPKQGPKTCAFCALPSLCRIAEMDSAAHESDREEQDIEPD